MQSGDDNPDRALLERLLAEGRADVPLHQNAHLAELDARLVNGLPGALEFSFQITAREVQGNGVVAGGTLMSVLDYAMAYAVLSKLPHGRTCATTSITVNMQAAARPGALQVFSSVDRVGRQVAFAKAEIRDAQRDALIATASATFAVLDVQVVR